MSIFVIDASVTLVWCFSDEATLATDKLLDRLRMGDSAIAPAHWPTEVMNGLLMGVRRQRITFDQAQAFAIALATLPIRIEPPFASASWDAVLTKGRDTGLTIYDAAYLQLASDRKLPLATLDRDLQNAARAASVPLAV